MTEKPTFHNLPVEAYTGRDWFDREQREIFSRTWAYAGFVEDLSDPGQYLTVQAGLNNLFVVHGEDGQLRAFHNMCRHRGAQLLRAVGKTRKVVTCPYHDWVYDLNGRLLSIPEEAKEYDTPVDKSCLGLKPASVERWRGMIFVHPDPNAMPLRDWFGPIEPYLGPHDVDSLIEVPEERARYEIQANWKIVVENYIDVYHLSHLHSGTLRMYDHARAEYGFVGPHFAFWEPLSEVYAKDVERNSPAPLLVPEDQLGTWVPMLFPGIGLAESESSWSTYIIRPLAPDRTEVESRTRVKNASSASFLWRSSRSSTFWEKMIGPKYGPDVSGTIDPAEDPMAQADFMAEDIFACESQQKAFASPQFSVGPAAKGESPILEHQGIVRDYLA